MPKQLELQDAAGNPLTAFNFGEVPAGQLSAPLAVQLKNTGDVPLTGVKVWIEQASTADGALRVTLVGIAVSGTSKTTANALPDLAPGAAHAGTAEFTSPSVPVDAGTLFWTAL